jgi:preprotein translocase subunit SecA
MDRLKMPEDEPIEAGMVMRSIESAQRKVEARNFDIRKQLLEYDDVSNDQRKVIYQQRVELLASTDVSETIASLREGVMTDVVHQYVPEGSLEEQWNLATLETVLKAEWQVDVPLGDMAASEASMTEEDVVDQVVKAAHAAYDEKVAIVGREELSRYERAVMLQSVDAHWREHLAALDLLRQGIHLRSFAQKNPKQEYKREAFELFSLLLQLVGADVTRIVMTVPVRSPEQVAEAEQQMALAAAPPMVNVQYQHAEFDEAVALAAAVDTADVALAALSAPAKKAAPQKAEPQRRFVEKVGRNDPCPCGSGKKYKQCHGRLE